MGPNPKSEGALTLGSIAGLSPPELLQPFWALHAETPDSVPLCAGGCKPAIPVLARPLQFPGRARCSYCRRPLLPEPACGRDRALVSHLMGH